MSGIRFPARVVPLWPWLIFDVGQKVKMGAQFLGFLMVTASIFGAPRIEQHPQREMVLRSLQRLVDEKAKKPENHFFVLRRSDGWDWIYWREGRLLWATDLTPYYEKKGPTEQTARSVWDMRLRFPRKPIDLDTGVVPTPEDVGTSTYLEPKTFVADVVYDCVQDGELVVIRKRPNKAPEPTTTSVTPRATEREAK